MSDIASFSCGFFNSVDGDRTYNAGHMSQLFDGLITDGVYAGVGNRFMVTPDDNTNNSVLIGSGRAWFNHTWSYLDSQIEYSGKLPGPETDKYRYDAIVIDVNLDSRENDILVVSGESQQLSGNVRAATNYEMAGTEAVTPPRPVLANTANHKQYPICYILRRPSTAMIAAADIVYMVGMTTCPLVMGVVSSGTLDEYTRQWAAEYARFIDKFEGDADAWFSDQQTDFTTWSTAQKNAFATWMAGEKTDFDTWFANLQYILDGDVAGHLQNEIDNLTTRAETITLYANRWSNGVYSLESTYPSNAITVENVLPNANTTSAMRKAWKKADCNGYESGNIIRSHGVVPTIDIVLTAIVRGGI